MTIGGADSADGSFFSFYLGLTMLGVRGLVVSRCSLLFAQSSNQ